MVTDLRRSFRQGSIAIQLIYINTGIFLLMMVLKVLFMLFNRDLSPLFDVFSLPASVFRLIGQPWTVLTYMFMHADIWHLLFNMLWLYWFGEMFLRVYSTKHLRGLYFFGGLVGGVLYILSYNIFPLFSNAVDLTTMVGASASILAIVVATAYRIPNEKVYLLLIGAVRLKYLAAAVVVLDVLTLTSSNSGGHIAHLGGALAGWWFGAALDKGWDMTKWINGVCDFVLSLFERRTWVRKKKPKMRVYRTERERDYNYNAQKKQQSDEVDRILEKLKKSGYQSLSEAEKKRLFDASQR